MRWQSFGQGLGVAAGLAAVLLAGGCAWYQEEKERAEILDTPSMDHMVAEVASFASSREQWPNDQWWTGFSSPELSALEETALKDNPSLKKAGARLREAQALVRVEGARLLPFLDAEASLTHERLSQHGVFAALNREVAGARFLLGIINPLSFRYEFDFWGKNRALLEAALGQAASEDAESSSITWYVAWLVSVPPPKAAMKPDEPTVTWKSLTPSVSPSSFSTFSACASVAARLVPGSSSCRTVRTRWSPWSKKLVLSSGAMASVPISTTTAMARLDRRRRVAKRRTGT